MDIGQKIRQIRLSRKLTQAELCGDVITRNMLSLIENGAASPSVRTLIYLAAKLDVPAGYLLSDDGHNSENEYLKLHIIGNIRAAFKDKKYAECIRLCETAISDRDDEINLILAECNMHLACNFYHAGHFSSARSSIAKAELAASETVYNTIDIERKCRILTIIMQNVETGEHIPTHLCQFDPYNTLESHKGYLRAAALIEAGKLAEAALLMEAPGITEGLYFDHLTAKVQMQTKSYGDAFSALLTLLKHYGVSMSAYMLYAVYTDLEECCRETDNFKTAYEYATKKLNLLAKSKK